jgi:hypothetical protein
MFCPSVNCSRIVPHDGEFIKQKEIELVNLLPGMPLYIAASLLGINHKGNFLQLENANIQYCS